MLISCGTGVILYGYDLVLIGIGGHIILLVVDDTVLLPIIEEVLNTSVLSEGVLPYNVEFWLHEFVPCVHAGIKRECFIEGYDAITTVLLLTVGAVLLVRGVGLKLNGVDLIHYLVLVDG
jgi:hypothetical protein